MDKEFITGLKELDAQHEKVFKLVKEIHNACESNVSNEELIALINSLDDYAVKHFELEESYARQYGFEKLEQLIEEHQFFVKTYGEIRTSAYYLTNDKKIKYIHIYILHLAAILEAWINKHYYTIEKELLALLKEKVKSD